MALTMASLRGREKPKPPIVLIYGVHGVGKTTLAAGADEPVLAAIEDGRGQLDIPNWPIATFGEMLEAIGALYTEEHDRKSLIVDSVDWLEGLVWAETCARNGWKNLGDPDFGKGYLAADLVWKEYLDGIRALRDERNMMIVQIAHCEVVRFDSPETTPYDRYQIKLHKRANKLVQEHADIVGFLNFRTSIVQTDVGPGKKVARGVGGGQRVLYLEERPAFLAKNRYGLPSSIDLPTTAQAWNDPAAVWAAFAQHLPNTGA